MQNLQRNQKTAILLAGGASSRLGRDKALVKLYGETLLETTFHKLREIFKKIFIVTSSFQQQSKYSKILSEDILVDIQKGAGPVGGILTGLKACKSEYAFVAACDMPLINKKAVNLILEKITPEKKFDAVVPRHSNGRIEPLHSLYKAKPCIKASEDALNDEKFQCRDMLSNLNDVHYMPVSELMDVDPKLHTFFNVNSELDLVKAKEKLKSKVFRKRIIKARNLEPEVEKELETATTIYYKVPGTEEEHEVRLNKRNKVWACDCKYFTLKGNYCSHILAARNLRSKNDI